MKVTFWVGVYPGMTKVMLYAIIEEIKASCGKK